MPFRHCLGDNTQARYPPKEKGLRHLAVVLT
ncbi:hypothetical protein PMI16_04993, partial [Herbaspirillum sp. CF444]